MRGRMHVTFRVLLPHSSVSEEEDTAVSEEEDTAVSEEDDTVLLPHSHLRAWMRVFRLLPLHLSVRSHAQGRRDGEGREGGKAGGRVGGSEGGWVGGREGRTRARDSRVRERRGNARAGRGGGGRGKRELRYRKKRYSIFYTSVNIYFLKHSIGKTRDIA